MKIEDLKIYLRLDFDIKIRPIFIKERCEHCGQETELHLHHNNKYFSTLLNETLTELKLSSTEEFTDEQARIIKYVMRGKQLSIDYLTLCKECHKEIHKKDYKKDYSKTRCKASKEDIIEILDKLVGKILYKEDREELIKKLNLRDSRNRLQKKISTLNEYLSDNYNTTLISKRIREDGKKVTIWILNNIE